MMMPSPKKWWLFAIVGIQCFYSSYKNYLAIFTNKLEDDAVMTVNLEANTTTPAALNYAEECDKSTTPDPTLETVGFFGNRFYSGFRNEAMAFTKFVMDAQDEGFQQILLPTIRWKDLFGTNKPVPHCFLFDCVYWNSFYPNLPKLVRHHPDFTHYHGSGWSITDPERNATLPYARGRQHRLFSGYKGYTGQVLKNGTPRHPVDILMLQGALRPHPDLKSHIQQLQSNMEWGGEYAANTTTDNSILFLHARVEPDMQKHGVWYVQGVISCRECLVVASILTCLPHFFFFTDFQQGYEGEESTKDY